MGRFISKDPVQDGRNWFVYCANNPLGYRDPSGLKITVKTRSEDDFYRFIDEAIENFEMRFRESFEKFKALCMEFKNFKMRWKTLDDCDEEYTIILTTVTEGMGSYYNADEKNNIP